MVTFYVGNAPQRKNVVELHHDGWDDWFTYQTLYGVLYYDNSGNSTHLGHIKIGQKGLEKGVPNLPREFKALDSSFFSLGQGVEYYSNIKDLGVGLREHIHKCLQDVAYNSSLLEEVMKEDVMGTSLMRSVSYPLIVGQFRRIANGGDVLSEYKFTYTYPEVHGVNAPQLSFHVLPESNPPTNIHVIIGRNGVGKTFLINNMIRALLEEPINILFPNDESIEDSHVGTFEFKFSEQDGEITSFVNIVSVAFSAFDNTLIHKNRDANRNEIGYSYVGLKKKTSEDAHPEHKTIEDLVNEFCSSLKECQANDSKKDRWQQMISILESDPVIKSLGIKSDIERFDDNMIKDSFRLLSSGHKIIVLTITKLVELTEERSLVIMDEPESHLHPPLLSAFIRAVSGLMIRMNAAAIIATHSPVVLQEVPKKCVWKISRNGGITKTERMEAETFGENVGLLTHEVFGLEVTSTGFYKMLQEIAECSDDYEKAKDKFNDELGGEAMAILRNLVYMKSQTQN